MSCDFISACQAVGLPVSQATTEMAVIIDPIVDDCISTDILSSSILFTAGFAPSPLITPNPLTGFVPPAGKPLVDALAAALDAAQGVYIDGGPGKPSYHIAKMPETGIAGIFNGAFTPYCNIAPGGIKLASAVAKCFYNAYPI